jgi:hypothetical protein
MMPPDGGGTDGWTPLALGASLSVWLDGSRGITVDGGAVAEWADQSGLGNTARPPAPGTEPSILRAALNGHDAVAFVGPGPRSLSIADAPSVRWGSGAFTVAVVARYTNAPAQSDYDGYGLLWSKALETFPYIGAAMTGNSLVPGPNSGIYAQIRSPAGGPGGGLTSVERACNDGVFRIIAMRRTTDGSTLEIRINGSSNEVAAVELRSVDAEGAPIYIGGQPKGQLLIGHIAEVVAGAFSDDGDVAALESYLRWKFGL